MSSSTSDSSVAICLGNTPSSSGSTLAPQFSDHPVGQSSFITIQRDTSPTARSFFSGSTGCDTSTTETVYVTAPTPTKPTEGLTTIHTTSVQTVTLPASSSTMSQSVIVPNPDPGSSEYPVASGSRFAILESNIVLSVSSSLDPIPESSGYLVGLQTSASVAAPVAPSWPAVIPSILSGPSYPATIPVQPTPSFYRGAPPFSYAGNNSTGDYPTATAPSASLTMLFTGYGPVVPSSSSITPNAVLITTPVSSMVTNNIPVTPKSYSTVAPSSRALSNSTQVQRTATPTMTTMTTTTAPSILVAPSEKLSAATTGGYVARIYKRDATTVNINIPVAQSLVSTNFKPATTPKTSSKPSSRMLEPNTNAPKPTSVLKPNLSSKPSTDDDVKTIVVSQDPRCPYPYPSIRCGNPITTVTTVKKATPTSTQSAKRAGSATLCPYPYPGGKGEACP